MGCKAFFTRFFCHFCYALLVAWVVSGCVQAPPTIVTTESSADAGVTVEISAPDAISLPSGSQAETMKLPLTVRLRNHQKRAVDLTASTACAVFRWSVVTAEQQLVQPQADRLCGQVVATATLARQLERHYEVTLDARLYTNHRYRLIYMFWGYSGHHDFTVHPRK